MTELSANILRHMVCRLQDALEAFSRLPIEDRRWALFGGDPKSRFWDTVTHEPRDRSYLAAALRVLISARETGMERTPVGETIRYRTAEERQIADQTAVQRSRSNPLRNDGKYYGEEAQ